AGHIVVQTIQVLSNLATQVLVQRRLQRTDDSNSATDRRAAPLGITGLLSMARQLQALDGAGEQQLHGAVLGDFLGQVDLFVGVDGAFHAYLLGFTTPGRLSSTPVR